MTRSLREEYPGGAMDDIDLKTLEQISHLVKIDIPEEKREGMLTDLEKILDYAHMLDAADLEGVAPCYHVLEGMQCPQREDVVNETFTAEDLLRNAPEQTGGMVKIPPLQGQHMEPQ